MLSVCICFLGLFSSAGCPKDLIPELEGDAGCVLPRGWRGNNLHSTHGSQAAKGRGCRK